MGISLQGRPPTSASRQINPQHTIRISVFCMLSEDWKHHEKPRRVANLCMARSFNQQPTLIPLLWSIARSCGPFLWSGAQKMLDNLTSRNDPLNKIELAGKTKRKKGRGKRNLSCPPNHMYEVLSHMREDTIPGQQGNNW